MFYVYQIMQPDESTDYKGVRFFAQLKFSPIEFEIIILYQTSEFHNYYTCGILLS